MNRSRLSVVFHVPHSSTNVPAEERASFLMDDPSLGSELLRMTDHYTDALFAAACARLGGEWIEFPVSRLVVDPERFEHDSSEPMAAVGMGVLYTRTSDGSMLRQEPAPAERERLLNAYYRPHHEGLSAAVAKGLERSERVLVVDCHSFPSKPLPYEFDRSEDRAQVCLGTDDYHTPQWLVDVARERFCSQGFAVAINRPFAGALVPGAFYRSNANVLALMVELNRSIYMDEVTGQRSSGFAACRDAVTQALDGLLEQIT